MKSILKWFIVSLIAANSFPLFAIENEDYTPVLPFLPNPIKIDGNNADWSDSGLQVRLFCDRFGYAVSASDFSPTFKLGWNNEGLLFYAQVIDDNVATRKTARTFVQNDAIALMISDLKNTKLMSYSVAISPKDAPLKTYILDYLGPNKQAQNTSKAKFAKSFLKNGYAIEGLIPWTELNIRADENVEFNLELLANDDDDNSSSLLYQWTQTPNLLKNPSVIQKVKLGIKASPYIPYVARAYVRDLDMVAIHVIGDQTLNRQSINVFRRNRLIYSTHFLPYLNNSTGLFSSSFSYQISYRIFYLNPDDPITLLFNRSLIGHIIPSQLPHVFDKINSREMDIRNIEKTYNNDVTGTLIVGDEMLQQWNNVNKDLSALDPNLVALPKIRVADLREFSRRLLINPQPLRLVIHAGVADFVNGASPEQITNDLKSIVIAVNQLSPNTQILIITPYILNPQGLIKNRYNDLEQKISEISRKYPQTIVIKSSELFNKKDGNCNLELVNKTNNTYTPKGYQLLKTTIQKVFPVK